VGVKCTLTIVWLVDRDSSCVFGWFRVLSTHPRFGWAIAAIGGICWGSGAVPLAGCRGRVPGKEVWAESFMLYKYS